MSKRKVVARVEITSMGDRMHMAGRIVLVIGLALLGAEGWAQFPALTVRSPAEPVFRVGRPVPLESETDSSLRPAIQPPQPVFRAQGPPPPPPPAAIAGISGDEAYNCGVVPHEDAGFCANCWSQCCDWCRGIPATVGGMFQPDRNRTPFRSDHKFDSFISPVSNPFYMEDPRSLTEVRPIFIWQMTPSGNTAFAGGDNFFVGAQARLAITENVSVVVSKLGWIFMEPNTPNSAGLESENGFAELHVGPKFTLVRNDESNTLLAAGLTFEIPVGSSKVFQNTGDLALRPYISFGQNFFRDFTYGSFNFMNTTAYTFRTDDIRSEFLFSGFHLDWDIGNLHRFYPLVELNWFHYMRSGNNPDLKFSGFEGADMFNFGAKDVSGNDELIVSVGGRWKPAGSEAFQLGLTGGMNVLGGDRTLNRVVVTADMIFRY